VRAAVVLGPTAINNNVNGVYGGGVHPGSNYATHGLFAYGSEPGPTYNTGVIIAKAFYTSGLGDYHGDGTGDFTPGPVGHTGFAAISTTNTMTHDGAAIHTF
jgi:hypothetical protein